MHQPANNWIRTTGICDGAINSNELMQDSHNPAKLRSDHDSGDQLHPGNAGYHAVHGPAHRPDAASDSALIGTVGAVPVKLYKGLSG